MADLRAGTVLARCAAIIEVGNLTLRVGGDELCGERYADTLPALSTVHIILISRDTLVPHPLVAAHRVGDGCVEVLLVNEQVVACGGQVALHEVAMDIDRRSLADEAVAVGIVVIAVIDRLREVTVQHAVGLRVGISGRCVGQQVLRLVAVLDAQQTVVIEEGRVEDLSAGGTGGHSAKGVCPVCLLIGPIVALEVDGGHVGVGRFRIVVLLMLCQIGVGVEVGHAHLLAAEVCRSTIDAVGVVAR